MRPVDRSRLPLPGPLRQFAFPAIASTTVGAGLDVRVVAERSLPVVSLAALVRGGSAADPAGRPGLAAFTADVLDDGAGGLDGPGLSDALARLGADLDIEVWPDATVVSITTLERHAERALAILADLVRRPRLADADIERVRGLRLDRLRQLRAQPSAVADHALTRAIYGAHPYGHPGIGDAAAVAAMGVDDIREFHARGYRPERTTLIVVGDVETSRAQALVSQAFGDWSAQAPEAQSPDPPAPPAAHPRVLLVARPGAPQSELRVGQVSAARQTPDFHALLLWNAALGGQFVSRLNLNLRQAKGYTYGVRSGFDFRRAPGPFSIHTSVQTGVTMDAVDEIHREVRAVCSNAPVTAEELTRAKAAVGLGYPRSFETVQQVARAIAHMSLHELEADHFAQFVPRLMAVTIDEVTAAAARHVSPDRFTSVIVGDPAAVEAQLGARGIDFERIDDAPPGA